MPEITVLPQEKKIYSKPGQSLMEVLLEAGMFVDNPCGGKGLCGKCKLRILEGTAPAASLMELQALKPAEISSGVRLSCLVSPCENLVIELMAEEKKHKVLVEGTMPDFPFAPEVSSERIYLKKPSLEDQTPEEEQITKQLGTDSLELSTLEQVPRSEGIYDAVLHRGRPIGFCAEQEAWYGVAMDIGTTTVVTSLIDLRSGGEMAKAAMINAQKQYGLDVLTRITYEIEHPGDGIQKLQTAITGALDQMIADMCSQAGIEPNSIYEAAISANCTMLHLLLGIDARPIGMAPFAPVFVNSRYIRGAQIGLRTVKNAVVYILPSVSAYIGADIVAGAFVCGLNKTDQNVLFLDIGTNGEIVLASGGKLLSCSCAAGPALEGMNISSGMRAAEGAVEDAAIRKGRFSLKVIGDADPTGLCGSGILAAVKELIRVGLVEKSGAFVKLENLGKDDYRRKLIRLHGKKREAVLTEKIVITQSDVRQVQLAKGAILSGFYALLYKAGISIADLDQVLIAGQFGANLPAESLTGTGMLPKEVESRIAYVGNTSKAGAYMALMSAHAKRGMEAMAGEIEYWELGASPGYERLFADCLLFPEY